MFRIRERNGSCRKLSLSRSNQELVTVRINNIKNSDAMTVHISIGKIIADLLGFKKHDYVKVSFHPNDEKVLCVEKANDQLNTHKLELPEKSNFIRFSFICDLDSASVIKKTIVALHEFTQDKVLFIDFSNLRKSQKCIPAQTVHPIFDIIPKVYVSPKRESPFDHIRKKQEKSCS